VLLILLIHIPEGRQATNMSTKNKFKSIQDSSLKLWNQNMSLWGKGKNPYGLQSAKTVQLCPLSRLLL